VHDQKRPRASLVSRHEFPFWVPTDGMDAASSNNGGLGMPPFRGQLSGAQLRPIAI